MASSDCARWVLVGGSLGAAWVSVSRGRGLLSSEGGFRAPRGPPRRCVVRVSAGDLPVGIERVSISWWRISAEEPAGGGARGGFGRS